MQGTLTDKQVIASHQKNKIIIILIIIIIIIIIFNNIEVQATALTTVGCLW